VEWWDAVIMQTET